MPVADPADVADVDEIDVQGLAQEDGYLWVVGSHSLPRDKPTSKESAKDARKQLARVSADGHCYLLARRYRPTAANAWRTTSRRRVHHGELGTPI
jgi:hypothetical protein